MRGKIFLILGVALFATTLPTQAGDEPSAKDKPLQIDQFLEPGKGGLLRGVHLNMTMDEVIEKENQDIRAKRKSSLKFSLSSASNSKQDRSNITYRFDEHGLTHITLYAYQTDDETSRKLFISTRNLFDDLYGSRYTTDQGVYWSAVDDASGLAFTVTVSNYVENGVPGFKLEYHKQD